MTKLLISNDDGIFALGIRSLANTLAEKGYDVTVVCPDRERSAAGHGLTLHHPIRADTVDDIFHPNVTAWSCSGTPSDCVKFALSAILDGPPDMVLSGINHGSNLGTDILYSGTVSAAMEGTIDGIPSLAFSLASYTATDFSTAAQVANQLLAKLPPIPKGTLLNVNIPPVAKEEIAGIQLTRQGLRRYIEQFEKRFDPRGKSYYWLAGEVIEDIPQPEAKHLPGDVPTDVEAIRQNYVTITPLEFDLTNAQSFLSLQQEGMEGLFDA
ncbi:MAG: 5'/3'-nucleotidase SurE [Cyanobacteria bacterium SW_9_44_58]|nr:MAG: 5'/3'-nucleotidase SurE [Cyanobacteria bacterium SW_9_44_58]